MMSWVGKKPRQLIVENYKYAIIYAYIANFILVGGKGYAMGLGKRIEAFGEQPGSLLMASVQGAAGLAFDRPGFHLWRGIGKWGD